MRPKIRVTAEFAFVGAALAVAAMGWFADLLGILAAGFEDGHPAVDNTFFRLNITFFAIGLAGIGVGYEHHERFLREPVWALRYLAGYLILVDGLLHAFALNDHLVEPIQAVFFGILAPAQVVVGLALPYLRRRLDPALLALTAFLIAAYVVTRSVPVSPLTEIEEVESLGILSKATEFLAVLALVQLLRRERQLKPQPVDRESPSAASPES